MKKSMLIAGLVIQKPYISSRYIRADEGTNHENIYTGTAGTTLSRPPRLTRIDFPLGHMTFNYKTIAGEESWSLGNIKIFSNVSSSPFLTVSLTKGAFDNRQDRLDGITFAGNDGETYCYGFEYNGNPLFDDYMTNATKIHPMISK